jgi:phosphotriesterase-related protein
MTTTSGASAMSAGVMTVCGPVSSDRLGWTSIHEHVLCDATVYRRRNERTRAERLATILAGMPDGKRLRDAPFSLETVGLCRAEYTVQLDNMRLDDMNVMTGELADFYASGGRTVVEMSALGLRTDVAGLEQLSRATGVHIVAAAGFYVEDSWPEEVRGFTSEQFARRIVSELNDGIGETGIRAGHIKLAVSDLSAAQEAALRGGARAAMETGAMVTVHPGFGVGSDGRRITRILTQEGLSTDRIVIAHADAFIVPTGLPRLVLGDVSWEPNLDYHRTLLDQGVNLSFDCFGQSWTDEVNDSVSETDWQRLAAVVALLREGYAEQLVLGNDVFLKMLTRRGGGEGYCRLTRWALPTLRRFGVSDYDINCMLERNPARLLANLDLASSS